MARSLLLWILTTVALAVAVPATWAQHTVVDQTGYSGFDVGRKAIPRSSRRWRRPLTTQLMALSANSGYDLNAELFAASPRAYTRKRGISRPVRPREPGCPPLDVHRHRRSVRFVRSLGDRSVADAGGQLDTATLCDFNFQAPKTLEVPLTEPTSRSHFAQASCGTFAKWGRGSVSARHVLDRRARAPDLGGRKRTRQSPCGLGALGLVVGAGGWAGSRSGQRYVDARSTQPR